MADQFDLNSTDDGAGPALEATTSPSADRQPRWQAAAMQVDADRDEIHLTDYIKVLYKRRWMALAVFLVIVGSVTARTFTATPIYQASATLLIEADNPNFVSFKEVIDEQQAKADYYQTQYNILKSRSLARKTMEELGLFQSATFSASAPPKVSRFSASIRWVEQLFGREATPKPNEIAGADETMAQSRAIDGFLGGLEVLPIRNSRLVEIKYSSPDPEPATKIVNTLAKVYIHQNLEFKFLASQEATAWLGERLKEQRAQVEAAEAALQRYREQNDAISLEDRENITVQKLADLNAAVTRAKTLRIEKEALYNQLRASQNDLAQIDTFPAILANSFIQQLKGQLADLQRQRASLAEKLGEKNPEMIRVNVLIQNAQIKLDAEIQKVVQSVRNEYEAALAQENSLGAALSQQKNEALSMNRKAIEYGVLRRDMESSKQLYNNLMQRAKETGVTGELRTSNIRVVDPAERPQWPTSPNKPRNLLAAIVGGGLTAMALAFLFEYMDSRIKTPDEIKAHLGLPNLGLLPLVVGRESEGYVRLDTSAPPNFSEAFRMLRTNIMFSTAHEAGQSVLITSTGPGEGKSLVSSNLAISLAQAGRRVLLIDADLRKPKVHTVFDLPQEPGLSNVLVGNSKASESVLKSHLSGLWILPAGRIPPNPAELLGSQRFSDFVSSLKTHFDWIVIDSPPVMAVADASVISHLAVGVLLVVGAEMTSRHAARRAIEQIEAAQGRFLGAVLNRVDLDRNSYYYSQYYRREYAAYYTKTS